MRLYLRASMQVHHDITTLPSFKNAVVTIGTFDGVHKGHQQLIKAMQSAAEKAGGETVLVTFTPHPRKILQPQSTLELINTLDEKTVLLEAAGLDHLVIVNFTTAFASLTGEEYLENFLIARFRPHTLIIGYDHHFGSNRSGNFELLQRKAPEFGYQLIEIPKHVLDEISVSSTSIRKALKAGVIEQANNLLGYAFSFEGQVVHGDKLGRTIGCPTANLAYTDSDKIHLGEGVYAVCATVQNKVLGGMLSIGKRPTLNDTIERVEVNLFHFSDDIYGQQVRVNVIARLRNQEKYDSLEALKAQLQRDEEAALAVLSTIPE